MRAPVSVITFCALGTNWPWSGGEGDGLRRTNSLIRRLVHSRAPAHIARQLAVGWLGGEPGRSALHGNDGMVCGREPGPSLRVSVRVRTGAVPREVDAHVVPERAERASLLRHALGERGAIPVVTIHKAVRWRPMGRRNALHEVVQQNRPMVLIERPEGCRAGGTQRRVDSHGEGWELVSGTVTASGRMEAPWQSGYMEVSWQIGRWRCR